jgi:phosphatidylglycerophosphate synthase
LIEKQQVTYDNTGKREQYDPDGQDETKRPPRWTRREEALRERVLGALLDRLPAGVEPDHLTKARIVLVVVAALDYLLRRDFRDHLILIVAAMSTDLLDGALARRRGKVHVEGARLDQRADFLLGAWLGVLTVWTASAPSWLLALLVLGQILVWAAELRQVRLYGSALAPALSGFAVGGAPPRPQLAGRLQFVFVLTGFLSLLADAHLGWPLRKVGVCILAFGAVPAALVQAWLNFEDVPARSRSTESAG